MFIFVLPAHTTTQPPAPPMVQECKYQVRIDANQYTYKCFTEEEYQQKISNEQKAAEESNKATASFLKKWWWALGIGFIALIIWGSS